MATRTQTYKNQNTGGHFKASLKHSSLFKRGTNTRLPASNMKQYFQEYPLKPKVKPGNIC